MNETKLYEDLAAHLDQGVIGTPTSPALLEILKVLFPPNEAEIAIKLPMQNTPLSKLKELFPDQADLLEDVLNHMAESGTVFSSQHPGKERRYRLLPSVVGWAETPFWAGRDTETTRKLAPLWIEYRDEAFGKELARGEMPVMRVLPVSKKLEDTRKVLPFDALKPKIEAATYRAVGHCPCRMMKRSIDEGCDHSLENCLHFGSMGRYMVEHGMAREITVDETFNILTEANNEGLVHMVDNFEGHTSTICNCCGCCCVFLDTKKNMGLHTISTSNYVAEVETDACEACGTCEERCPMDAVTINGEDTAVVDPNVCIGCGVCTPSCPNEAIDLSLRGEVQPPPQISEVIAARLKTP